jgi:hypothetical protein
MTLPKIVQFLIEKAETIFLRAKHEREKADKAEKRGQESETRAAELLDVAQTQRADADKAEAFGQQFDAKANTLRKEATKTEVLVHQLKAEADAQYEIAKVRREGADDSQTTASKLETKAVEIETEIDREKKKNP